MKYLLFRNMFHVNDVVKIYYNERFIKCLKRFKIITESQHGLPHNKFMAMWKFYRAIMQWKGASKMRKFGMHFFFCYEVERKYVDILEVPIQ